MQCVFVYGGFAVGFIVLLFIIYKITLFWLICCFVVAFDMCSVVPLCSPLFMRFSVVVPRLIDSMLFYFCI